MAWRTLKLHLRIKGLIRCLNSCNKNVSLVMIKKIRLPNWSKRKLVQLKTRDSYFHQQVLQVIGSERNALHYYHLISWDHECRAEDHSQDHRSLQKSSSLVTAICAKFANVVISGRNLWSDITKTFILIKLSWSLKKLSSDFI